MDFRFCYKQNFKCINNFFWKIYFQHTVKKNTLQNQNNKNPILQLRAISMEIFQIPQASPSVAKLKHLMQENTALIC